MMEDIKERSEHYRSRAHRKARSHYLAAKRYSKLHGRFGVPVVVISTIVVMVRKGTKITMYHNFQYVNLADHVKMN